MRAEYAPMAATQEALYGRLDIALSWSEQQLPERERTKHVHRLHPYLGKFVPQLVEMLLDRYVAPAGNVLDPFAGSGTTLVQALESGRDASGVDVAGFNCLLMRVKTRRHNLETIRRDLLWAHGEAAAFEPRPATRGGVSVRPGPGTGLRAAAELLAFPGARGERRVGRRAPRRPRACRALGPADDPLRPRLPSGPQLEPYWCHKHRRSAGRSGRRGGSSSLHAGHARRIESSRAPATRAGASVLHGDAREPSSEGRSTRHHLAALPGADRVPRAAPVRVRASRPGGAALDGARPPGPGVGREAIRRYVEGVADVLANARSRLAPGAPVCVVVNDRRGLYSEILGRARLRLDERLERHVNRRTGRRAGVLRVDPHLQGCLTTRPGSCRRDPGGSMRTLIAHRPSPAMVVACIALFVALGGTSVAAVTALAPNSVGTSRSRPMPSSPRRSRTPTSPAPRSRTTRSRPEGQERVAEPRGLRVRNPSSRPLQPRGPRRACWTRRAGRNRQPDHRASGRRRRPGRHRAERRTTTRRL